jgi:hypothetical protein
MGNFYNDCIYRKNLVIGMMLSYPVLRIEHDDIFDAFFIYNSTPHEQVNDVTIAKPEYWIIFSPYSGKIHLFSELKICNFLGNHLETNTYITSANRVEGLATNMSIKELASAQKRLYKSYDELRGFAFTDKQKLSDAQRKTMQEYIDTFKEISPTGHKPFYKAMGPEFFKWLDSVI